MIKGIKIRFFFVRFTIRPRPSESLLLFRAGIFLLLSSLFGLPLTALAQDKVEVKIEGVGGALLENIRAYLSLEKPPSPLTETVVQHLYHQASGEITKALQALGYYHPRIDSELNRTEKGWTARFKIDPGPPVHVTQFDLTITGEGNSDPEFQRLEKKLPIRVGEILNQGQYEEAKSRLQNLAAERGYLDAHFTTHRIELDLQQNQANIQLAFETGARYQLGRVRFKQEGEYTFNLRFLERFIPFQQGEPYHTNQILALNNALINSGYFSSVDVRPIREEAEDHLLPIEVTTTTRKRYQLSAGLGYGTDTGPRATLGWEDHRINQWGHRFKSELEISSLKKSITADYQIPLKHPATDKLDFQAGFQKENTVTAESRLTQAGVSRSVLIGKGWVETLFINYRAEKFTVGDEQGNSRLILPGVTLARTLTDQQTIPRRGSRISFTVQGTDETFGSDLRLFRSEAHAKVIRPFGERGRILVRGDFGWSVVSDFRDLPPTLRFFAGGDQSVRGYSYNSLGPEDPSGHVIGGRRLAVGSIEYDHRIAKQWGVALFYDAGNAFNRLNDFTPQQGVGVGGRWYSPVGPIRVDLAYAIDKPGIAIRVHVNMGPDL